ncbi:hypothetical protein NQ318_002583 [Aromia moschata]|uniref:Uncharacterized protein n=1 Tax=Aromia moschata TaxID=1265417 RepID=A0AAV8Y731_9CUCU|nr:hypothetical protein NQ318_002583 [Aromia moschata]
MSLSHFSVANSISYEALKSDVPGVAFSAETASQRKYMLETASIAGGATIAVFSVVILCVAVYLHYKRRTKATRTGTDCVDSRTAAGHTPTFGTRWRTNPPVDLPIRAQDRGDMKQNSKVELHQVTTLLPATNEP